MIKKAFNILVILCFTFVAIGFMYDSMDITIQTDSDEAFEFDNKGSEDLTKFLEETKHINFNHPIFSDALKHIVTLDMNLEQKLKRLFYFTRDTIPFDPSTTALTASDALKEMKAICYTKAMIYVSFCRRLGVPANVALEEFIIFARPKEIPSVHGIAKIYYKWKWIYLDTVSNKEAWSWWDKKNAHLFEPPVFSLEHNVLVDERFVSNLALKDFETNDVPAEWFKDLDDLKGWLAMQILKLLSCIRLEFIIFN